MSRYSGYCPHESDMEKQAREDARYDHKDRDLYERYSWDSCKEVYTREYDRQRDRIEREREEEHQEQERQEENRRAWQRRQDAQFAEQARFEEEARIEYERGMAEQEKEEQPFDDPPCDVEGHTEKGGEDEKGD